MIRADVLYTRNNTRGASSSTCSRLHHPEWTISFNRRVLSLAINSTGDRDMRQDGEEYGGDAVGLSSAGYGFADWRAASVGADKTFSTKRINLRSMLLFQTRAF